MGVYIGLDCGGTACRALAIDDEGRALWRSQSGSGNLASTPDAIFERNLDRLLGGAPEADSICGCFAGLLTEEDRERAVAALAKRVQARKIFAYPDVMAVIASSDAELVVIAGTGSLVASISNGALVKTGGGGFLLGDEGSGFRYGRSLLKHYLQYPDGATATAKHALLESFGTLDASDIVSRTYRPSPAVSKIAGLLEAFVVDLEARSSYAVAALEAETSALAVQVLCHTRKVAPDLAVVRASLAGGVWKASPLFADELKRRLQEIGGNIEWKLSRLTKPPVYGAAILARELVQR